MKFEDDLHEHEIHTEWSRLQDAIEKKRQITVRRSGMLKINWKRTLAAAASVVLAALLTIWISGRSSQRTYATGYGEQKHIILPDSSRVVLNSNSSLRFNDPWWSRKRQARIRGEAVFSVVHTVDDRPFIVRTPGGMQVSVLGTEFNIFARGEIQRVVLNSGSVQLQYENRAAIRMVPGEMVSKVGNEGHPMKTRVDPSRYFSWVNGKLLFDNTPLKEVCQQIEDQFGLAVSFPDSLMGNRLFNGTFPADNAQVLLKALMKTYQLDAICNGNRVEFRRKEEQPK
ncbi:MAG: FecR domain-containing protein [Solitalea sp.]